MSPWEQDPPTDLLLFVRRAAPARWPTSACPTRWPTRASSCASSPPAPSPTSCAPASSSRSSTCAAGNAPTSSPTSAAPLDRGLVRGIDNVTTRTLTGSAYPKPGLFSKFFDAEMNPLVEVVQDTVGRHDSFNLACTARYYEDQGYFGHANCSDNFTDRLAAHGLPPQKGWPAINLFFNTVVDAQSAIHFDEPWSRPGDYVLLRAATDLVCASSACPCDIDAANGWVLTDIHVRVYPETNLFKRAVGYRMTPDAPLQLTKETGFHRSRRGAHPRSRRVSRLLAAQQLRQGRPDRGILGLPRALRRDRPLALAQVRGAGPRCRDAAAAHAHPQRPQAGGGPGGLLGHVLTSMAA